MSNPSSVSPDNSDPSGSRSATAPSEPMAAFAELGRINLASQDLNQVLATVAELTRDVLPGAEQVSVTLVTDGLPGTATFTGELALALDEKQYETGYGPCLDAAASREVRLVADMSTETRWPKFCASAVTHGVCSSLSVGIPIQETLTGALNIYATKLNAFQDDDVALARTFAGYAAVAMANAHLYATTSSLAAQMATAMSSRAVIEQAKGILIAQQRISAQAAFDVLSRASQVSNRKLREVAQAIVDKAQSPDGKGPT